jgi:V/A-type H+/Na+-transporting ATPase subunit D
LASARRSADLLDRKRQLLRLEQHRLAARRAETLQRWTVSCEEAEHWGLRATLVGGASDVGLAALPVVGRSRVEITWRNTMGVRHPDDPRCSLEVLPPVAGAAWNAAVGPAAAAYREALEAGAAHAVADRSWRIVGAELHATERRLRAMERHRLPGLEEALRRLELRLEELERQERVVTRWAERRRRASPPDMA